jgi:blocked-early-in-transport protein 1
MTTSIKGSATRLTRMAASGNKVAVMKLAGLVIVAFLVLYYGLKIIF